MAGRDGESFVDLAGGFNAGKIVILPMASSVPEESATEEPADFKKLGAQNVEIRILTREQALKPEREAP